MSASIWLQKDILHALRAVHFAVSATQARTAANDDYLAGVRDGLGAVAAVFGIEPEQALELPGQVRTVRALK